MQLQRAAAFPVFFFTTVLAAVGVPFLPGAERVVPGTALLTEKRPLDEVMVDGINRFCLQEISKSIQGRQQFWNYDSSSVESYAASIEENRKRFQQIIGAVDLRVTLQPDRFHFELLSALEQSSVIARTDTATVHAVRWQVLEGVTAEGLLLVPQQMRAGVVAIPDADWTPEMFCGVVAGLPAPVAFVRQCVEAGCLVAIPAILSRSQEFSGHPAVAYTNQPHREFLYRQAFEMGRHPLGYEVQKVLAAVDLLAQIGTLVAHNQNPGQKDRASLTPASDGVNDFSIGVAGVGEGGLLALYAAALEPRIDATLVSGYFQERLGLWKEPIYRNVWRLLTEFGDAEIASMVAPRRLVVEACQSVDVPGPPVAQPGRRQVAAPGRIETNLLGSVVREFRRAETIYERLGKKQEMVLVVSGQEGAGPAGSSQAVASFAAGLKLPDEFGVAAPPWQLEIDPATLPKRARAREKRQLDEMQTHVQNLLRRSAQIRDRMWKADLSSLESWLPARNLLRDQIHDDLIGRLDVSRLPVNARSRLVLETPDYRAYEVVLDVCEDIIAAGILLLPNDLMEGEQRPVVVCQHGLEGTARDTLSHDPAAWRYYKAFSEQLCQRGFIVYAPQNPYRGGDRFRTIQRKANPVGLSLFSFIIAQHDQTLKWLSTLPGVDSNRIAFYGLSYGGKTAMRVPTFVDRYCLSICSGDFTAWVKTITTNEEPYGYLFTGEYEIPEWNMGHLASYAELAKLMSPRPFMVEQGHRDGGAPTEWVLGEYGKVLRHYDLLKIGDRTEIEMFDGTHTINGEGSFTFLTKHLNWPKSTNTESPNNREGR